VVKKRKNSEKKPDSGGFLGEKRLTMIQVWDIFIMRGWDSDIPPRTIPGRFASGVFLFICFQIVNIQIN